MTNSREHAPGAKGSPWRPGQPVVPGVTRRRFLQYTALGTAAAAAAGLTGGPAGASVAGRSAQALPKGFSGTIADLKHVVILVQENRSFDHYFGTLSGVRGFGDKKAMTLASGRSVFQQPDPANPDGFLLPYHLDSTTSAAQAIPSLS